MAKGEQFSKRKFLRKVGTNDCQQVAKKHITFTPPLPQPLQLQYLGVCAYIMVKKEFK